MNPMSLHLAIPNALRSLTFVPETKRCRGVCQLDLPLKAFYKRPSGGSPGYRSRCKACHNTVFRRRSGPRPTVMVSLRITEEDKLRYVCAANKFGITLGEYVRTALENFEEAAL